MFWAVGKQSRVHGVMAGYKGHNSLACCRPATFYDLVWGPGREVTGSLCEVTGFLCEVTGSLRQAICHMIRQRLRLKLPFSKLMASCLHCVGLKNCQGARVYI